jgi:hypothetical protein
MGRKIKYKTKKEKKEAQKRWQMEHYKRNCDKIKAKARQRYREKIRKEFYDKKVQDMYGNLE